MVPKLKARSGTFTDNMKLPIHRWFRYSAGFSAKWVESEVLRFQDDFGCSANLLDPFVGSGTTVIAAQTARCESTGYEAHPFIFRIAQAKMKWMTDIVTFSNAAQNVLKQAQKSKHISTRHDEKALLGKCYSKESLSQLERLKLAYENLKDSSQEWDLVWLAITSILRPTSHAGTAQWQYVLPGKKTKAINVYEAYNTKINQMLEDMQSLQSNFLIEHVGKIIHRDIRLGLSQEEHNLLITSPPYPNNYDYADSTRLEMTFWGEIEGWKDLKTAIRPYLMRSCSQHTAGEKLILDELLGNPLLEPILPEITAVTKELEKVRLTKGGKKTYHTMIAAYFLDLAQIWINIRAVMAPNSRICFVVGDSAPYGVHAPAEDWLGRLALAAGFNHFSFEKLRDRNVKWKNRKHTVPLHEGRLWVEG